jgi:hypothetical protein
VSSNLTAPTILFFLPPLIRVQEEIVPTDLRVIKTRNGVYFASGIPMETRLHQRTMRSSGFPTNIRTLEVEDFSRHCLPVENPAADTPSVAQKTFRMCNTAKAPVHRRTAEAACAPPLSAVANRNSPGNRDHDVFLGVQDDPLWRVKVTRKYAFHTRGSRCQVCP